MPITTRQLESLVRLAQARAKLECRAVATEDDARDVVALLRESVRDACTTNTGAVDYGRHAAGFSASRAVKALVGEMQRYAERRRDPWRGAALSFEGRRPPARAQGALGSRSRTLTPARGPRTSRSAASPSWSWWTSCASRATSCARRRGKRRLFFASTVRPPRRYQRRDDGSYGYKLVSSRFGSQSTAGLGNHGQGIVGGSVNGTQGSNFHGHGRTQGSYGTDGW